MDKNLIEHPDGVGEFKFKDKKCLDRVRLFIKVEKNKISNVDSTAEGCKKAEEAAEFLVKALKNKSLEDL
ncbi:MAG: iron-sulfur cluster assembly scaffold protein, partial [Candidatus Nanoarchaeia archaeon]|nr:iron-sulfur cluster assembly scaffold protein [Candidatus Nanoarchaeia archaeon]